MLLFLGNRSCFSDFWGIEDNSTEIPHTKNEQKRTHRNKKNENELAK